MGGYGCLGGDCERIVRLVDGDYLVQGRKLTEDERQRFGIPADEEGVVVSSDLIEEVKADRGAA